MQRVRRTDSDAESLLTPSLQGHVAEPANARRPWRLGSQVYVAFLGGCLAVTVIAAVNARAVRVSGRGQAVVIATGVAGFVATLALAALAFGDGVPDGGRVAVQLIAVIAWGPMYLVQRPADRVYSSLRAPGDDLDEAYESLLGPGLLAVLVGGFLQILFVFGVAG